MTTIEMRARVADLLATMGECEETDNLLTEIYGKEQQERVARQQMTYVSRGLHPICGRQENGKLVWYTGRAGSGFVSEDYREAFIGYNLDGARLKAKVLSTAGQIYFMACNGDLLDLFRYEVGTPEHSQAVAKL